MDITICQAKTLPQTPNFVHFSPTTVSLKTKNQQFWVKNRILRCGQVSKFNCGKVGGLDNLEKELIGIKKLNGKCKESVGIVELLECLGKEAIMGEDEGREAKDYNRRAVIFDKSSKVFQALKEQTSNDEV